jgi:GNAT superfamily N-acetyltransferase
MAGMGEEVRYLDRSEYPLWDALVEASPQGSVSCLSWWLDAISQKIRVLAYFENGRLIGGVPLHPERMFGLTLFRKPKLTIPWGVVIEPLVGKGTTVVTRQIQILDAIATYLADIKGSIVMSFHPNLQNWLPFRWHGFSVSVGATHLIENLDCVDTVRDGFARNTRRWIAKATDMGMTVEPCSPDEALKLFACSYERQGQRLPYSDDYFGRLYAAAKIHNAGECLAARDRQGQVHAAGFLIWDKRTAYYVASGGDPALRASGAGQLLVWHVLQFAAERAAVFDFGGSSIRSIEEFMRSFGAKQTFYPRVAKFPLLPRLGLAALGKI